MSIGNFAYANDDPDGYATRDQIVQFIEDYARTIAAPIKCNVCVQSIQQIDAEGRFEVGTSMGPIQATNVVVATGPFQRPLIPDVLTQDNELVQLHSSDYRNTSQLPSGATLVVGGGASGAQIADEILRAGRRVFLSLGRHTRVPRRYRGRDQAWWRMEMGTWTDPIERRKPQGSLAVTGAYGGYTIDYREFAARGAVLLGRAEGARDGIMHFADDLALSIAQGDASFTAFLDAADSYVVEAGLVLPDDPAVRSAVTASPFGGDRILRLNLREEGIASVVWATGYTLDFGWLNLPVFNENGAPLHERGVTPLPGFYFLGLTWQSRRNSAFFNGVGYDAEYLARHIMALRFAA